MFGEFFAKTVLRISVIFEKPATTNEFIEKNKSACANHETNKPLFSVKRKTAGVSQLFTFNLVFKDQIKIMKCENFAMVNYAADRQGSFLRLILAHPKLKSNHVQKILLRALEIR